MAFEFDNIQDMTEEETSLALGKKEGKQAPTKKKPAHPSKDITATDVSEMSQDELDELAGKEKKKKVTPSKKEEVNKDDDDDDQDAPGEDDDDTDAEGDGTEGAEGAEDDDPGEEDDETLIKSFLSERAKLLIKQGKWYEWDDWEKEEWSEERFEEIELEQAEAKENEIRENLLNSFGPYGNKIAEYSQNGGDPDKLIDIFKEQQRVVSLPIDTEEGQRAAVLKYETEFLGKKAERVQKYINNLIVDKELEAEAKEAKEAMAKILKDQETDELNEQKGIAEANEAKEKQQQGKFVSDVNTYLDKDKSITPEEKKKIKSVLTVFDKPLGNGKKTNQFTFEFQKFRKDLPNYINLVRFVLNPEKFIKSVKQEGASAEGAKNFSLIRGGKSGKGAASVGPAERGKKTVKSTFKLL